MCGIAGIITKKKNLSNLLKKLNEEIIHRGPDDAGSYICKKNRIGLTMTRLSIIGLEEGHQPKFDKNKNIILIFNGEIFNYRILANKYFPNEIIKSDTDIILKLYIKLGLRFVSELNGMFSIAIFDKNKKKLFIFRDRFGIKPLYYSNLKGNFYFCSELKPLERILGNLSLSYSAISDFISMGFIKNPFTVYKEINKLEPASILEYCLNSNVIKIKKWYTIKTQNLKFKNQKEVNELVESQILKSLKLWTISDVPISIMLSGGIDSSLLAAMYQQNQGEQMTTYSNVFKEKKYNRWNEKPAIDDFIKKYSSVHSYYYFRDKNFLNNLEKIINHLGEPFGGGLPSWFLLEEISKKFKVVITGIGGDELFGNYNRQFNYIDASKILSEENFNKFYFFNKLFLADNNFKKNYTNLSLENNINVSNPLYKSFLSNKKKYSVSKSLSLLDFKFDLTDDYLYLSDRFSMAHSLELRTPYLDHELVELVYSLPEKFRISRTTYKPILRNIAKKYLPKSYFNQNKKGFSLPISFLMRNKLLPLVDDLLSAKMLNSYGIIKSNFYDDFVVPMLKGSNKNIQLVWNIFVLQYWLKNNRN